MSSSKSFMVFSLLNYSFSCTVITFGSRNTEMCTDEPTDSRHSSHPSFVDQPPTFPFLLWALEPTESPSPRFLKSGSKIFFKWVFKKILLDELKYLWVSMFWIRFYCCPWDGTDQLQSFLDLNFPFLKQKILLTIFPISNILSFYNYNTNSF